MSRLDRVSRGPAAGSGRWRRAGAGWGAATAELLHHDDRPDNPLPGERSILDSDGSTLIIHSEADDNETDPSGESGDRIAAGIIEEAATGESTTPARGALPGSGGADILTPPLLAAITAALIGRPRRA